MGYTCMEIRNCANIKQYIAYIVVEIVFIIFLNFNAQENKYRIVTEGEFTMANSTSRR